ncbi:MAG TPA: hypothetical protein VLI05_02860 [Candidatus Saccharimonadia bacterium]|nr:hypothetical protein [Candidatus Saccharimonadia bacterium]
MDIPLTAITTAIGVLVMFGAWFFVGQRMRQSHVAVLRPVQLFNQFFLSMAVFFTIMAVPHIWLFIDPSQFPIWMAWGYVVGHIFLYLAFINIIRMTFTIVPKLTPKAPLAVGAAIVVTVAVTIINAVTMIFGTRPSYDYVQHVTQFNASPIVGASIGIFAALAVFPPAILFIVNAFKAQGNRRVRSLILGIGLILLMTAGPLHDVAKNWQTYMLADIFSILSIIVTGTGVVYRLEQSLTVEPQPVPAPTAGR